MIVMEKERHKLGKFVASAVHHDELLIVELDTRLRE